MTAPISRCNVWNINPTGAVRVTLSSGGEVVARVLRYLPGGTLSGSGYLSPSSVAALGRVAGSVSAAARAVMSRGISMTLAAAVVT